MTAKRIGVSALLALAVLAGLAGLWLLAPEPALAQSRARVVLDIDDSDSVVAPGSDLDVHIWVRNASTSLTYSLRFFHAVGGPALIDPGTKLATDPEEPDLTGTLVYVTSVRLVVPLGSPSSNATLSAMIDVAGQDSLELGTATLIIGDAGDPVDAGKISSAIEEFAKSGTRSSTSQRSSGTVYLKLEALNGRGKLTNDRDVKSIIITATGGLLSANGETATHEHFIQFADDSADAPDADALTEFTIKPIDRKPVHIDVYAYVIGEDGSVQSNTLGVNFAGQADTLQAGPPSGTLAARHGSVRIAISGLDSDDNRDTLSTSQILVDRHPVRGPEGADLDLLTISKKSCGSSDRDCEKGDVVLIVTSTDDEGAQAEHGIYEIEFELKDDPDEALYTTLALVVGEPTEMTLELLDGGDPAVRRIFTTTGRGAYEYGAGQPEQLIVASTQTVYAAATLLDEEGVLVSNTSTSVTGDGVKFQIVGALTVTLFSSREVEIIDGVAYVRFLVAGDEGRALIIATSRDLEGIASIVAQEKARFGLDGLIKIGAADYTTWIGANDVRVSELYPLLKARGINSVHLWLSGEQRWLAYAVVEDAAIPGSVDFLITYGDTLWLGG